MHILMISALASPSNEQSLLHIREKEIIAFVLYLPGSKSLLIELNAELNVTNSKTKLHIFMHESNVEWLEMGEAPK